jgi:hypothetical protein
MKKTKVGSNDYWEVSHAAGLLTGQACTISAQHIQDGMLRIQFNREVAYYARGIVRDVEDGRKTAEEGLRALEDEQKSLLDQSLTVGQKVFGLLAGGLQIAGGLSLCGGTIGLGCGLGLFIAAQGANNVYENGNNLLESRSDTEGLMRDGYQAASHYFGGSDYEGNMAYGTTDLIMSGWGYLRLVPKKDAWRLYYYFRADKQIAFKQTRKGILVIDGGADIGTMQSMGSEWGKNDE